MSCVHLTMHVFMTHFVCVLHNYIHTYMYTHTYTYIHIHTYIHTYIHIHAYIHTHTHTQHTQVSLARAICKEQVSLQLPLFPLHGYTADTVMADPRVKLEHALREAGLHTTSYARHVISNAMPPHPPRRDQFSTVFNYS